MPGDASCSTSLSKQNVSSTLSPLASNTTSALRSEKQDKHFEARYKFRQNHWVFQNFLIIAFHHIKFMLKHNQNINILVDK